MNFDRIENDTRRAELIRVLEHSIERLSLAELEGFCITTLLLRIT